MKPDGLQKWDLLGIEIGLAEHYPRKGWAVFNAIREKSVTKHQKPNSNTEKLWVWEGEEGTVEFKKQETN